MTSVMFSRQCILPIRGRAVGPARRPQTGRATPWRWRTIADTASSLAFLGTLGWVIWHLVPMFSRMVATGTSSLF